MKNLLCALFEQFLKDFVRLCSTIFANVSKSLTKIRLSRIRRLTLWIFGQCNGDRRSPVIVFDFGVVSNRLFHSRQHVYFPRNRGRSGCTTTPVSPFRRPGGANEWNNRVARKRTPMRTKWVRGRRSEAILFVARINQPTNQIQSEQFLQVKSPPITMATILLVSRQRN
jgi:hypothetical protein